MINVTKSFLPPLAEYTSFLEKIWQSGHLTNNGSLVQELEEKIKAYLGVKHFFYLNNGTIALQIAIKALDLKGEIITTPFSYVATTSSIVWENATPVFADIDPLRFTLDPNKIEDLITDKTSAILATHVYGIPCDVEAIKTIAEKYNLKVIYDAAHAFGVEYKNQSVLNYGDVSTLSFHATKLFHTVEGGGIITNDDELAHRISYMRNFGHNGQEEFWGVGINGKNSEFHAAMGLCNFPYIMDIIESRKKLSALYDKCFLEMGICLQRPEIPNYTTYNFSYYPVVFNSENELITVRDNLNAVFVYPRRYFYPSLHKLPYITTSRKLPIAIAISEKVLCLPLYHGLPPDTIKNIASVISKVLKS